MTDRLSTTFAALADPTRRAILARLATGEASVTELGEPFAMSLPAVSKHLKVLERAGLIARGREAQWRPCRLEAAPLKNAMEWLNRYRSFWSSQLDRLAAFVEEDPCPPSRVSRSDGGSTRRRRRSTQPGRIRRR
ncbi:MAG: metalloregulator ArsR/SmtB family transcription factor [Candidatus Binatia bacterium]